MTITFRRKGGDTDTGRWTPCNNRGRDWSYVAVDQGLLSAPEPREKHGTYSPLEPGEEAWHYHLDF